VLPKAKAIGINKNKTIIESIFFIIIPHLFY